MAKAEMPKMRFIVVSAPKDGDEGERRFGSVGVDRRVDVAVERTAEVKAGRRVEVETDVASMDQHSTMRRD
jgi:hypothetical protein